MRSLRRVGASLVMLCLLLGLPWGLWQFGSVAAFSELDWSRLWSVRDDGSLLVGIFTAVGWAAWAVFALATVVEGVGLATGRRWRVPGLGWAQALAGALLVAVMTSSAATLSARVAVSPTPPAPQRAAAAAATAPSVDPVVGEASGATPSARAAHREPLPPAAETPRGPSHVVQPGDDLWTIASQELGSGLRWRDIWELNRSLVADPDHLEPGWVLRLPAEAAQVPASPADGPAGRALSGSVVDATSSPSSSAEDDELPRRVAARAGGGTAQGQGSLPSLPPTPAPEPAPAGTEIPATLEEPASEPGAWSLAAAGLGSLAAAAVLGVVATRRQGRESSRPVGRRFVDPSTAARRLEALLAASATSPGPDQLRLVQRVVADHCRPRSLPHLDHALMGPAGVELHLAEPCARAPIGFVPDGRVWRVPRTALEFLRADEDGPLAWPALVPVGERGDDTVLVDLAEARHLAVEDAEILAALAATAQAAAGIDVLLLAGLAPWETPGSCSVDPVEALEVLPHVPPDRTAQLDRDLADAHRPRVVIGHPRPTARRSSDDGGGLLLAAEQGRCALVAPGASRWRLEASALHTPRGQVPLVAARLSPGSADGLTQLVSSAASTVTEPADWWADDDLATVTWLRPRPSSNLLVSRAAEDHVTDPPHPTVRILGPIELLGARGPVPPRAVRQCVEYATWLLENPGATASQMANALVVAEGTRRSNMSRLRSWLGEDDDGTPYLPDAYSGRIFLAPTVTSDWHRLRLLLGPGVNRVSPDSLAAALDLVRGAPLADAAPGQWVWAEPLRSDMVALVRDAAATLAQSALDGGDVDLVRWATARGLVAAPADELLLVLRIRAEHRAGNHAEVDRLVGTVTQHARRLGVDLADETVTALQEVVEGQRRAQRV